MHGYAAPYPGASTLLSLAHIRDTSESLPSPPIVAEQPKSSNEPVDLVILLEIIRCKDQWDILSLEGAATWGPTYADRLRRLEANVRDSAYTLTRFAEEFRSLCEAAILHGASAAPENAQAASLLLDHANQQIEMLQNPSTPCTAAAGNDVREDPFWAPAELDLTLLLSLQAFRGAGLGRVHLAAGRGVRADIEERKKRMYGDYESDDSSTHKSSRKKQRKAAEGRRWIAGLIPAAVASEIVELLRALTVALSRHAQLEAPPHDTGAAETATAATGSEIEAAAYSHLKPLPERVALARKTQQARLQNCQAVIAACVLPVDFTPLVEGLIDGEYEVVDSVIDEIMALSRSAAERLASDAEAGRRSKLLAIAEAFAVAVIGAVESVVSAARTSGSSSGQQGSTQRPVRQVFSGALPQSIVANREPYMQGDWRREPYIPRPYVRLKKYEIAEEKDLLASKFRTDKRWKCSGEHCTTPGHLGTYTCAHSHMGVITSGE